jgi:DNA-binding response OmpR family regulator
LPITLSSFASLPTDNFSPREKAILNLLLSKSGVLVTTDEIGDILFSKQPESYSLYAISKFIQRLRDKLEQNGLSGSFIQTKRGEGYLLAA